MAIRLRSILQWEMSSHACDLDEDDANGHRSGAEANPRPQ
jgi:hypothetical protein